MILKLKWVIQQRGKKMSARCPHLAAAYRSDIECSLQFWCCLLFRILCCIANSFNLALTAKNPYTLLLLILLGLPDCLLALLRAS
jgi:hypothetical protein